MAGRLITTRSYAGDRVFEVVVGDLLGEPTDAIVNAANGGLSHGGGVAAAILEAAGSALETEGDRLVKEQGRIPTGGAVMTTAGNLPFKGVIHAVGPRMGEGQEEAKLVKALWSAFRRADEQGWSSVSFPAVSAGIFSVPANTCVRAYFQAVERFYQDHPDTSVRRIRLVLMEGPVLEEVLNQAAG